MTGSRPRAAAGYVRFLGASVAVAAAVAALGYLPTLHLGGAAAIPALLAGCAVAVVASAAGGVPIALSGPEPATRPQAALLAMAVRLATVLALGLAAVASGLFAARPLAIWTAISYVALLAVDSRYAMLPGEGPGKRQKSEKA
jgi:hypothetical protein